MSAFFTFLLFASMVAVAVIMLGGLIAMARGKSIGSNRFMRWRVMIQGVAIAIFVILVLLARQGGAV